MWVTPVEKGELQRQSLMNARMPSEFLKGFLRFHVVAGWNANPLAEGVGSFGNGGAGDDQRFGDLGHGLPLAARESQRERDLPRRYASIFGAEDVIDGLIQNEELAAGCLKECLFANLVDLGSLRIVVRLNILDRMMQEESLAHGARE